MSDALPDPLVAYLEQRDAQRADAVRSKLASLSDWERQLVKDAAVMGYVQGMRHPRGEAYPGDVNVVPFVVGECLSFPDLYPAINTETNPTEDQRPTLAFERSMYAAAIQQLILQIRKTAYVWSQTLPDTISTTEVTQALSILCSPKPLPEDLRDDLWQRIVAAYYLRFENDGHSEDAKAAADEAMTIVQPELDRLRTMYEASSQRENALIEERDRLLAELEQARNEAGR